MIADYQVHVVLRNTYDQLKIGQFFAGGEVIEGINHRGKLLIVTYHGADANPKPARTSR